MRSNIFFSVVKQENEFKSIRDKYHAKISTATSKDIEYKILMIQYIGAAHFGSETRQDLPIDDHHFTLCNFNTTTNDSYRLIPQTDSNRIIYGPKRSQLYFGDLGRAHNYDTVHHTSFIKHETRPIKLKKLETRQSAIFNSKNYGNDSESLYITTLSDAYKGAQLSTSEKVLNVSPKTGTSHIQFGQSNDKANNTDTSVTKRDYGKHPTHHAVLRNPSSIRSHGIQKAMQPSNESFKDGGVCIEPSDELTVDQTEYEPAGISFTKGLQEVKNQSSVPEGDIRFYNTCASKTTSKEDFIQYPPQTRVVLNGGSEVQTKFRIFNHDADIQTNFQTTSKTEYVEYSKEDAQLVRSAPFKPSPVSNYKLGDDVLDCGEFKTTQHSHFCTPVNASRRAPQLPQLALPNRLFPLAAKKNPHAYQTSFADYFPAMIT